MCGMLARLIRKGPRTLTVIVPPPLLDLGLPQRHLRLDDAGAVDQDVEPPEGLQDGAHAVVDLGRVGDLGPLHEDPPTGRP